MQLQNGPHFTSPCTALYTLQQTLYTVQFSAVGFVEFASHGTQAISAIESSQLNLQLYVELSSFLVLYQRFTEQIFNTFILEILRPQPLVAEYLGLPTTPGLYSHLKIQISFPDFHLRKTFICVFSTVNIKPRPHCINRTAKSYLQLKYFKDDKDI